MRKEIYRELTNKSQTFCSASQCSLLMISGDHLQSSSWRVLTIIISCYKVTDMNAIYECSHCTSSTGVSNEGPCIWLSFYSSKLHSNNFFLPASKLVAPNCYLECYQPSCYQGLFFEFEDVVATQEELAKFGYWWERKFKNPAPFWRPARRSTV